MGVVHVNQCLRFGLAASTHVALPLDGYLKSVLFSEDAAHYRAKRKTPVQDDKLLAEVLACLGASRISSNLNQLAKAVNQGALYVDEDVKSDIVTACNDVCAMRLLLMQALGMQVEPQSAQGRHCGGRGFSRGCRSGGQGAWSGRSASGDHQPQKRGATSCTCRVVKDRRRDLNGNQLTALQEQADEAFERALSRTWVVAAGWAAHSWWQKFPQLYTR